MLFSRFCFWCSRLKSSDKIVFFGSAPVGQPSLEALVGRFCNLEVVTHHSNPGRKLTNDVELFCQEHNIKYHTPIIQPKDKSDKMLQWRNFVDRFEGKPKLGVVCSYGFMIPDIVIDMFSEGMIVVHPSILPKYRGGAPIFHAIANGDPLSGVSYIEIAKGKFDAGSILHQCKTELELTDTYPMVEAKLASLAAQNLPYVVDKIQQLRPGVSQDKLQHTIDAALRSAPIIYDRKLNLHRPAMEVYNWSRALQRPRLSMGSITIIPYFYPETLESEDTQIGQIVRQGKKLFIRCSDKLLRLKAWQEEGKKQLGVHTFIDRFMKEKDKRVYWC